MTSDFGHMLITALANLTYDKEGTSGKTTTFSLKGVSFLNFNLIRVFHVMSVLSVKLLNILYRVCCR